MRSDKYKLIWGLIFGIIFGFLLHKGGVTKYDVIINQLLLTDFTVLKVMLSAVVVGMFGIFLMQHFGWITLRPKSGSAGKNIIGGSIFGAGFAVLGYCPGTIAGAVGNGALDALVAGLIGIVLGSGIFAAIYPRVQNGILKKGAFSKVTVPQLLRVNHWVVIVPLTAIIIGIFFILENAGL